MAHKCVLFMSVLYCMIISIDMSTATSYDSLLKFESMEGLRDYAMKNGKQGERYILKEPNKPEKIILLNEETTTLSRQQSGILSKAQENSEGAQETILDKINNFNYKNYIALSKSFRKLQDTLEDVAYSLPAKHIVGPAATYTNVATGMLNEKNDRIWDGLYHGVRKLFGLKGPPIVPDYNTLAREHGHDQTRHKTHVSVEEQKEKTKGAVDELEALLGTKHRK